MSNLFLYPTLNDILLDKVGVDVEYPHFFYNPEIDQKYEEEIMIELEDYSEVTLKDDTNNWNIQYDNLIIRQEFSIEDPRLLFGENGLLNEESNIGVAVIWHSKDSKQQGTNIVGSFNSTSSKQDFTLNMEFEKRQIRNNLKYSIVLYSESIKGSQTIHANSEGLILGILFESYIDLEGDGSMFPIVSIEDEGAPLWDLYCTWGDHNDLFVDSIRLRLNKSHKDYKYLDKLNKRFDEELFKEILISVVVQIVLVAKEKSELEIMVEEEMERGSIGELVKYYVETFSIDTTDSSTIFKTVVKAVRG